MRTSFAIVLSLFIMEGDIEAKPQPSKAPFMHECECANLRRTMRTIPEDSATVSPIAAASVEVFPILTYDSDVGFGYGMKVFLVNYLGREESLDLILFNSTKGERWYRLVLSIPDFELRQGKHYPWAIDFVVDYDKWIAYSFFGIGNSSRFSDREIYTREPLEISLTMSRGISPHVVGQLGLRYKTVRNFNFAEDSRLVTLTPELNASRATATSVFASVRYDTRDSYINPSQGVVVQGEIEFAPHTSFTKVTFTRLALWFQGYSAVFYPKTVFAVRIGMQHIKGSDIPIQFLLPIGGSTTLRGSPQDRYLDRVAAVSNVELRFPIFWRLGGVIGFDAGKVWHDLSEFDLHRWATNPTAGLRLYMETFVVRADVGFGKETTGFYLNFGQMF